MSSEQMTNIRFASKHPKEFSQRQFAEIGTMRHEYYSNLFPNLSDGEVGEVSGVANVRKTWDNPNHSELRRSRRANPNVVVAYDDDSDRLLGFLYSASDASSSRSGILGTAEQLAKLHIGTAALRFHRYLWLRELITRDVEEFPIKDMLGAIATTRQFGETDGRPMSIYPWAGEDDLVQTVQSWGMSCVGEPEAIPAFIGRDEPTIEQYRFVAPSINLVHHIILQKDDNANIFAQMKQT